MKEKSERPERILVIGQTPPPYGGQAVMIEELLNGQYPGVELIHVRMSFSKDMEEVGKFGFRKIWHLINVILTVYYKRFKYRTSILYYPPGGYNKMPLYRDILLLFTTRWLFKKTIFHFHASGSSDYIGKLPRWLSFFYQKALFHPDITIRITELNPPDGERLKTKLDLVVYNGIRDHFDSKLSVKDENEPVTILFIGNIRQEKGVECLLKAGYKLKKSYVNFRIVFMGQFESPGYYRRLTTMIQEFDLEAHIRFVGVLSGQEKLRTIAQSDIFCLPSHLETFGVVCVEAMQFKKPVVASNIPALTKLVQDGENGFLFEDNNETDLAAKLDLLCRRSELRQSMGTKGRQLFLEKFSHKEYIKAMNEVFQHAIRG